MDGPVHEHSLRDGLHCPFRILGSRRGGSERTGQRGPLALAFVGEVAVAGVRIPFTSVHHHALTSHITMHPHATSVSSRTSPRIVRTGHQCTVTRDRVVYRVHTDTHDSLR